MIIELSKHIKVVRPEAKSMFPYSNSLFIDDEIKTIIDAGSGGRAYAEIPTEHINLLLLTHFHFDHINGVQFFSNARIMAGFEEAWAFEDEEKYNKSLGYEDHWEEYMGKPRSEDWKAHSRLPDDIPATPGFKPIKLAGVFKDGDIFNLGETTISAIHTPGHSPGHYAFFIPKEGILFSGDLDVSPRGPWFGMEFCDLDEIIDSIHKLIALKPNILVSSHRKVMYSGVEDLLQGYLEMAIKREEEIEKFLAIPRTLDDIAVQNFINEAGQTDEYILFWQKMMIDKHLKRLIRLGRVDKTRDGKYTAVK
jgi:glyoxylase-like metal-dependent hydrolase (beta-lactamase superfamily II)